MYSLLAYLGGVVIVLGIVGSVRPDWMDFGWRDGLFLGLGIILLTLFHFAYVHRPRGPSVEVPRDSVVFALAFEPEDKVTELPGLGNRHLACWLANNTSRAALILTQEAIIWALRNLGAAHGYVPNPTPAPSLVGHLHNVEVHRMHAHDLTIPVRTLETLDCALGRFGKQPDTIVLVTHDKHYERTCRDLRSLLDTDGIVNPNVKKVPYRSSCYCNPLCWALRELFVARPIEFFQRHKVWPFTRLWTCTCRERVKLGPLPPPWGPCPVPVPPPAGVNS